MEMDRIVGKLCKICKKWAEVERIEEKNVHYMDDVEEWLGTWTISWRKWREDDWE
jgi:hypothetical protein